MASGASSLQDVLSQAKDTEKGANKYQQSVEKQAGHTTPQSQYQAAYKARKAAPPPKAKPDPNQGTSEGLNWKNKQVNDYVKQYGPVK